MFDEPFFGDPLPLFLELGLHEAHDGWTTVSRSSQLEQVGGGFLRNPDASRSSSIPPGRSISHDGGRAPSALGAPGGEALEQRRGDQTLRGAMEADKDDDAIAHA